MRRVEMDAAAEPEAAEIVAVEIAIEPLDLDAEGGQEALGHRRVPARRVDRLAAPVTDQRLAVDGGLRAFRMPAGIVLVVQDPNPRPGVFGGVKTNRCQPRD